jgi:hypothetical protein
MRQAFIHRQQDAGMLNSLNSENKATEEKMQGAGQKSSILLAETQISRFECSQVVWRLVKWA